MIPCQIYKVANGIYVTTTPIPPHTVIFSQMKKDIVSKFIFVLTYILLHIRKIDLQKKRYLAKFMSPPPLRFSTLKQLIQKPKHAIEKMKYVHCSKSPVHMTMYYASIG